tara:strand:- start:112 stop:681 length:570 start_codon:yes stop_codon:yes gene_type:complete
MLFAFILIFSINANKKYLILFIFFIIFTYSFELNKFLKINKKNIYELNSFSFDTDPIFLGLDSLIKENKKILDEKRIHEVYVSRSTKIIYKIPQYLYKDVKVTATAPSEIVCECNKDKTAIINFFPKLRRLVLNFRKGMPSWPEGYGELWGPNLEPKKRICIIKMNNTCSIVKTVKEKDGDIIAALGLK